MTEYLSNGSLLDYLRSGEGQEQKFSALIDMATNIASGMAYIESRGYVHRDLAARNVLVDANRTCKVADFGLACVIEEGEYETKKFTRFAIRWTAPEVIESSQFTIKSDVWSFGIVLTELYNKGKIPYPGLSNAETVALVKEGQRMQMPDRCPEFLYELMLECWHQDSRKRPSFEHLRDVLPTFNIYQITD